MRHHPLLNIANVIVDDISPRLATFLATAVAGSQAAVWFEWIKGVSAVIVAILGVPTAALILAYWVLKFYRELKPETAPTAGLD